MAFATAPVTTALSDPTQGNGGSPHAEPAVPNANAFIGDYSNIAVVPGTNRVVAYWTDLRNQACFAGACGHGEDAYFASVG